MQKLKEKILNSGLTSSEFRVALFLALVLFAGSLLRFLNFSTDGISVENYDYSEQDSLFYLGSENNPDTLKTERNVEKNVASEQELLDFTDDNFSKRDKSIPKIYEKSININLADKSSLVLLPSIGEKTAEKIIEYRTKHGKFNSIEEIKNDGWKPIYKNGKIIEWIEKKGK